MFLLTLILILSWSCKDPSSNHTKVEAANNPAKEEPKKDEQSNQDTFQIKTMESSQETSYADNNTSTKEQLGAQTNDEILKTGDKKISQEKPKDKVEAEQSIKPIQISNGDNKKPEVIVKPEATQVIEKVTSKGKSASEDKTTAQRIEVLKEEQKLESATNFKKENTQKEVLKINHNIFDQLLKNNVSSSGKVNYQGLKIKEATLDKYLLELEGQSVSALTKKEQLAYWINAYNAYTIKLILKNYPVSSITDLHNGKPWDVKWIQLDGKTLSLNNIENDIIRPQFNEPRIHFAVNCAAKSCPPLLNKAWTADNLEANFEKQTKAFINNSAFNKISTTEIKISKIFEWYGSDFGNLKNFINKYASTKIEEGSTIGYLEYNWQLNN